MVSLMTGTVWMLPTKILAAMLLIVMLTVMLAYTITTLRGVMIFMTQRETKKQFAATDVNYALAEAKKLNPYKIAKQKGISLEEAQAYCEKERAKAQKAVDKANAEKAKAEAARQAELAAAEARIEAELEAARAAERQQAASMNEHTLARKTAQRERIDMESDFLAMQAELRVREQNVGALSSREHVLVEMIRSHEGYQNSVRLIMDKRKLSPSELKCSPWQHQKSASGSDESGSGVNGEEA